MARNVLYVLSAFYKDPDPKKEVYYWRRKKDALQQMKELINQSALLSRIELYREEGLSYIELKTINL